MSMYPAPFLPFYCIEASKIVSHLPKQSKAMHWPKAWTGFFWKTCLGKVATWRVSQQYIRLKPYWLRKTKDLSSQDYTCQVYWLRIKLKRNHPIPSLLRGIPGTGKPSKLTTKNVLTIVLGLFYFNALRNGNHVSCIWQHLTIINMKLTEVLRLLQVHCLFHFPYLQNIANIILNTP